MICFFDTSALVKLFHIEKGSDTVEAIISNHENEIWVLELVRLEFFSSISRRYRQGELSEKDLSYVINDFEEQVQNFNIEPMGSVVLREAEHLMKEYGAKDFLRSLDALHLATFRLLSNGDWNFVCADEKLCNVAEKFGMKIINPLS
jgi:predicted nucleic acid-binding protein